MHATQAYGSKALYDRCVESPTNRAPHMTACIGDVDHPLVWSYTEWQPLEEVIVGVIDGAMFPPWHVSVAAPIPRHNRGLFRDRAGTTFPTEQVAAASRELEQFVDLLEGEGVRVRRPEPKNQLCEYGAPGWRSTGLYDAMPRDVLLILGDEILECPMAWRSRYYATSAYRPLLKEYFRAGARWTAAPKPELSDQLYDEAWADDSDDCRGGFHSVITEFEPAFDAADFTRCGRDIFCQRSHVTNEFGIEWLRRHVDGRFRVHVIEANDDHPMHIDATLLPLAPGKLLVNPERLPRVPAIFAGWDILCAPTPVISAQHPLYMSSNWLNMNLLSIDEDRVVVEEQDQPMIAALKDWGFTPIPCPFRNFNSFGGSFHCATLDVRRRGPLESYF